ncbi:MAG: methylase [Nitrososphaeria archaeon]|nr:methylase [Nitrososphaeria archaeon]NIN53435.1 methylase [Nitrososphaeria archaeon]NIQ33950.1 methylase [Nitrososphaeria archaeon]
MTGNRISTIFSVAIPDTFTSNYQSLLQKSLSIGILARACAIFRVGDIYIYREKLDTPNLRASRLIFKLLSYLETPQYLRKHLYRREPGLRHVGMLPPLRTPHHKEKIAVEDMEIGSVREGVVVGRKKGLQQVYVGLDEDVWIEDSKELQGRVTVRIKNKRGKRIFGEVVDKFEVPDYWGFRIHVSTKSLSKLLRSIKYPLKIFTSRRGRSISEVYKDLKAHLSISRETMVVFGGPYRGIYEILEEEDATPEELGDYVVNTVPGQGTETIRVEEAVYITLGLLNGLRR